MNGLLGEGERAEGDLGVPGLVRRGGELERCRASGLAPESGSGLPQSKAFGWLVRRGRGMLGGASTEPRVPGLVRRGAGRRTPCAERAVMLTAVQSLRLLERRGGRAGARPYPGGEGSEKCEWLVGRAVEGCPAWRGGANQSWASILKLGGG